MIPLATDYDFTTISTPGCISGALFGDAMCPRLEQLLWLNEAVRTAECRGGFNPLTGYYPSLGTKNDPATMFPKPSALADFQTRINAVLTAPYHNFLSLPYGVWNGYSTTWSMPRAFTGAPTGSYPGSTSLTSAVSSALVTPQAAVFSPTGMWPSRSNIGAYSTAVERGTFDSLYRSAVSATSGGSPTRFAFAPGLDSVLDVSEDREWQRNGSTGNTPMQDWKMSEPDYPHPFLDEIGDEYTYDTDHSVADYYRVKTNEYDTVYTRETATWTLPVNLPPWTYTGNRGIAAQKRTTVQVQLIWRVVAVPIWGRQETLYDGSLVWRYERDATVSGWIWAGQPNTAWFGAEAARSTTGLRLQFPAGSANSIVKTYGDHIISETLNASALASSGPIGQPYSGYTRVGYAAQVFCVGGVFVALTANRDIGT